MIEETKYSVEITGPALSFLYFSVTSPSNGGFLFGTVEEKQCEIISDTNEGSVKQETIIRICGIYPFATSFFHENFSINNSELDNLTTKQGDSVVIGWFFCRRNSNLKPSFRETVLHNHMSMKFSKENLRNFVFILVQDTLNDVSVTKEFAAKFFQFNEVDRVWLTLLGTILNCNKKSSLPNTPLYRSLPTLEPSLLESFEKQQKNLGLNGEELLEGIISSSQSYLAESLDRICKITSEIAEIHGEIARLQKNKEKTDDITNTTVSHVFEIETCSGNSHKSPPPSCVQETTSSQEY